MDLSNGAGIGRIAQKVSNMGARERDMERLIPLFPKRRQIKWLLKTAIRF